MLLLFFYYEFASDRFIVRLPRWQPLSVTPSVPLGVDVDTCTFVHNTDTPIAVQETKIPASNVNGHVLGPGGVLERKLSHAAGAAEVKDTGKQNSAVFSPQVI